MEFRGTEWEVLDIIFLVYRRLHLHTPRIKHAGHAQTHTHMQRTLVKRLERAQRLAHQRRPMYKVLPASPIKRRGISNPNQAPNIKTNVEAKKPDHLAIFD